MNKRDYVNVVKEQLRAYDFLELDEEMIEEVKNELRESEEEELTPEEEEALEKHSVFVSYHENGVFESVAIIELDEHTVDEIKQPILDLLRDNEDEFIEQDDETSEGHYYYLFVANHTTEPLHTVVENYTFEGDFHGVYSVLADMTSGEVYFKNDFSFFDRSPFLKVMKKNVVKYFVVSP